MQEYLGIEIYEGWWEESDSLLGWDISVSSLVMRMI